MSKLLKSKILLGVMIVAVMLVGVAMFATSASAEYTMNLKQGMRNAEVSALQAQLGVTPVTGYFGSITKAAVMAFQANKGLTADGKVGPMTRAALNADVSGGGNTTPTGCENGALFNPMTGASCSITPTPTGCENGALFNPMTGASCSITPTPTPSGTAGSVDTWTEGSADVSSVREGDVSKEILVVDAELANDGDVKLERADIYFGMDNALANTRPWNYFKEIALTVDGVEVAKMEADSSSDWTETAQGALTQGTATNQEYRMRFSGLSAILKSNTTAKIGVTASILSTIDSGDQDAVWQIGVTASSFKVVDGSGFATTDGSAIQTDISFGSTKEAVIDIRDASTNVDASLVEIDATEDTEGVTIYQFEIEESNNVKVAKIEEITMTFTTGATAGEANESTVIRRAYLYDGSTELGSESVTAGGAVTFDNLNFSVDADSKKVITVKVDLNDVAAGVDEGTDITVGAPGLAKFIDVNGNDESDITETVSGGGSETFELRSSGIKVTLLDTTANPTGVEKTFTADSTGEDDQGTFKVSFAVEAFGADMYIDASSEVGGASIATGSYTLADAAVLEGEMYRAIINGTTVAYTATAGDAAGSDAVDTLAIMTGLAAAIDANVTVGPLVNATVVDGAGTTTINLVAVSSGSVGNYTTTATDTSVAGTLVATAAAMAGGINDNVAGQGVEFMERDTAGTPVLSSSLLTSDTTKTGDVAGTVYKVDKGTTRNFTLTVIYSADSTPTDGSVEVYLESINWGTAADDTNANYYIFDLGDYKSGYLFLNGIA